jgi:hypothetical protein
VSKITITLGYDENTSYLYIKKPVSQSDSGQDNEKPVSQSEEESPEESGSEDEAD